MLKPPPLMFSGEGGRPKSYQIFEFMAKLGPKPPMAHSIVMRSTISAQGLNDVCRHLWGLKGYAMAHQL